MQEDRIQLEMHGLLAQVMMFERSMAISSAARAARMARSFPVATRSPGDLAHKRWKHRRATGRA